MSTSPTVVVLIPHYNNPKGLLKAIKSIDEDDAIDVLVVDDGSAIEQINEEFIMSNVSKNINISYEYLAINQGIEHALNHGLSYLAKKNYKYIARLDCDDICAPGRFKKQYNFLEKSKDIDIVGSFINFVNPQGLHMFNLKLPTEDKAIKKRMFINAMLIHPAIFFRKSLLKSVSQYPTNYQSAEDYAFYFEVMKKHNFANIDEYLVQCEINPSGISIKNRKNQLKNRLRIIWDNFDYSLYAFYGLLRNSIIYITPYSLLLFIKKIIKR